MELLRLQEMLDQALCEEEVKDESLDKLASDTLGNYELDLLDCINDKDTILQDLAEQTVYTIYDDALCINVKGRPYIEVEMTEDEYDKVNEAIYRLAASLDKADEDFVVYGRMGGYWGYKGYADNIMINESGFETLKNKLIELVNNEDNKPDMDYNKEQDNLDGYIDTFIYDNKELLAEEIDADCLSFKSEYLDKLNNLAETIDKAEEAINRKEF